MAVRGGPRGESRTQMMQMGAREISARAVCAVAVAVVVRARDAEACSRYAQDVCRTCKVDEWW